MRLSQVDLNLFVVFDAIYSKRNLTRVAEMLSITQPAVSNALTRMRKTFNDQLFVSTPKGMVPTPVAENIYNRVSEALNLLSSSVQEGDLFVPEQSKKIFRLSMNDLSESLILPELTEHLQKLAPGVGIESYLTPRADVANELAAGSLDLAIDAPVIDNGQLFHSPLITVPQVCMLRNDHPWSGDKLTMDDYLSFNHIHISGRRKGLGIVDAELSKIGKSRKIHTRVQHYMVAPLIALNSDLALTTPYYLVSHYDARLFKLPFETPAMDPHIYWHKSSDQDQANRWIRKIITTIMRRKVGKSDSPLSTG